MQKVSPASLDWALQHLILEGDGDLFPRPFEIDVIQSSWAVLRESLANLDISTYLWKPVQNVLVPKEELSFRRACQMEPLDAILYSALIFEIGNAVEKRRRPMTEQAVFSYRFSPNADGSMYGKGNPWKEFWTTSVQRSNGRYVATVDISDFYNQIYHHTIENQLNLSGVDAFTKNALLNVLKLASITISRGIPVGPHASHLLAEMSLIPLDDYLRLKGLDFCRFVDDVHIFCSSYELAQAAVYEVADFLDKSQKLSLNKQKTTVVPPEQFAEKASQMLIDNPINEEEKKVLQVIQSNAGPYTKVVLEKLSKADLDLIQNADLIGILASYISADSPNYVRLRWFLRRLSQSGLPSAVEYVVVNLASMLPALGDLAAYLNSAKDSYQGNWPQLGDALLKALQMIVVSKNEYLQTVLLSLFSRISPLNHIDKLVQSFDVYGNLARRQIILAARESTQAMPWLQSLKASFGNMDTWQKRALLHASVQIPKDERKHWLQGIQAYLTPLEKAIADAAKAAS